MTHEPDVSTLMIIAVNMLSALRAFWSYAAPPGSLASNMDLGSLLKAITSAGENAQVMLIVFILQCCIMH